MGKILVTGGTGFIGSHTCVALTNAGYPVVVMDNLSNSKVEAIARIEMITGKHVRFYRTDMRDEADLEQIFEDNKIDAVIHFAGMKAVGESVEKPLEYYENNVSGTLTLLRVMRKYGCRTMIFSSSATVYGSQNPVPYREEMPTSATNPYGYTKVMIEQILRDVCAADPNFTAVALRYFNPIGAHMSGLLGENPNGIPNNLVPYVAQVASGTLDHVQVYGSSVLEVIHAYEKACGRKIPVEITDRRAGDVAVSYADVSKAKELLGWEASADLQQMCSDSWRFTLQNPNGL